MGNSKFGIFLANECQKNAIFGKNPVFEGFWLITLIFVITFGWKLPKSSPMCFLKCGSSGTLWKIQNRGFFWPKNCQFWQKSKFEGFWLLHWKSTHKIWTQIKVLHPNLQQQLELVYQIRILLLRSGLKLEGTLGCILVHFCKSVKFF